ncbi:MAG TPA: SCO family protein [Geobacteraceae bacterium]|nr:SCO family protein [Geobacteraceae bacterium]
MKHPLAIIAPFLAIFICLATLLPSRLAAHTIRDEALPNVGVDEKLGSRVPSDLIFTDQDGRQVRLGDYLTGGPVVLTLNYFSCPTLCPLVFRNLANTTASIKGLSPDRDYRIVTVSIDPEETRERARAKAEETWRMLAGITGPDRRWPFLFDNGASGRRLAAAAGVRYTRLEKNNFAHPSVILILTPDGRVARYLYGIELRPTDLKLALTEAADGKIGGSPFLNQVILYCYHYDAAERRYALAAMNIMKIAGGGVLLLLGGLLLLLWRRERRPETATKIRFER